MNQTPTPISLSSLFRAQFGEDRILWRLFQGRTHGYFIEVGAYDGITLSNTFFLEQMGWSGILIEPIRAMCERAVQIRPRSRVVHAACGKRGSHGVAKFTVAQNVPVLSFLTTDNAHRERCQREGATLVEIDVPLLTLDDVIRDAREHSGAGGMRGPWVPNIGWDIDLVSIDTEGSELDVLDGFALERYRPKVLVIENDRPAGEAVEPYLHARGYRKVHRQKINDFYARTDLSSAELSVDALSCS
ncbi:MAG: FkbM family methyltransferase [Planctomycetes bacterium]|nr:FkbM family methyltransferase [Planctomycetota bacterium]